MQGKLFAGQMNIFKQTDIVHEQLVVEQTEPTAQKQKLVASAEDRLCANIVGALAAANILLVHMKKHKHSILNRVSASGVDIRQLILSIGITYRT